MLGANQYGKAETRVVRIYRDTERHEIRDLNVSTALRGDFADAHTSPATRPACCRPTPRRTPCFAYAKEKGVGEIEDYALRLARHFVDDIEPVAGARVEVEEYGWERIAVDGDGPPAHVRPDRAGGPHRRGDRRRTRPEQRTWIVSGLKDLVAAQVDRLRVRAASSTDGYTTLAETRDRILATSLTARWRYDVGPCG